jgi:peroxiredoxin
MRLLSEKRIPAPEIVATGWVAGEPILLAQLRGRVVLLDFFSFADPEGIRALRRLRCLADHYREAGLTVLGIHVPAYDFERTDESARREIWRLGIPYPVALDQGFHTYREYENRDLPARFVLDREGFVRGWHHGPGGLIETEKAVRALLAENRLQARLPPILEPCDEIPQSGDLQWMPTPEVRFGARGVGFGPPGEDPASSTEEGELREFGELPEIRAQGRAYLGGRWTLGKDRITSQGTDEALAIVYEGASVEAVLSVQRSEVENPGGELKTLKITLDGEPIPESLLGADVESQEGGSSVVVDRGRLYELISPGEFGIHNLDVRIRGRGVAFHLLSFGTVRVPEER